MDGCGGGSNVGGLFFLKIPCTENEKNYRICSVSQTDDSLDLTYHAKSQESVNYFFGRKEFSFVLQRRVCQEGSLKSGKDCCCLRNWSCAGKDSLLEMLKKELNAYPKKITDYFPFGQILEYNASLWLNLLIQI